MVTFFFGITLFLLHTNDQSTIVGRDKNKITYAFYWEDKQKIMYGKYILSIKPLVR